MRDEHLRIWIGVATQEERPDPGNWEKVVTTIHAAFRGGELTAQCAWKVVVITPKGGGTDFRGIVLVEIMWKAISGIINRWIFFSIQFHYALHRFCAGRGTGNATLEAKLIQQLIFMR